MIKPRAWYAYYRMFLEVHFEGDSEILNHDYEREVGHTSEDEFTSDDIRESNNDDESNEGLLQMFSDTKPSSGLRRRRIESFIIFIKQQPKESRIFWIINRT